MQVSKINSTNSFKGLWQPDIVGKRVGTKQTRFGNIPIYTVNTKYHPFKDETQKQIDNTLKEANDNNIKVEIDRTFNNRGILSYIITVPTLGEKLDITKTQYYAINSMGEAPYFSETPDISIEDKEDPPEEVVKIAERI